MKKILFFFAAAAIVVSCSKTEDEALVNPDGKSQKPQSEWKFTQEIEVTDISSENSVFIAVHSNDEEI